MNKKCLWFGHKLEILKDDKTIYCSRCNKKMTTVKKGFGVYGLDIVREFEPSLIKTLIPIGLIIIGIVLYFLKGSEMALVIGFIGMIWVVMISKLFK